MIVTTSYRVTPRLDQEARSFAQRWGWPFVDRNDCSIAQLKRRYRTDEIIVLSAERVKWIGRDRHFTFHPSLSVVRIKRLLRGESDVFEETVGISEGDSFLDCTLGFAADAITAAHIVGDKGQVVGLESERRLAAVVAYGLQHFPVDEVPIQTAMKRVEVLATDHLSYLRECSDGTFDVVYFDPMFREARKHSPHMDPLRSLADPRPLTEEAVQHACRVARKRVVLKEARGSGEFSRLGFRTVKVKANSVSYGIIETGE